jgi:hypothetical protein
VSITVPTAEVRPQSTGEPRRSAATFLAVGVLAVGLAWPALQFAAAPAVTDTDAATVAVAAPEIGAPVSSAEVLWQPPVVLPPATEQIIGVGTVVLAVAPDGLWPVSMLGSDGQWQRLLGLSPSFELTSDVAVPKPGGFSVVGSGHDRSVVLDFRHDGRFNGARTVFGIAAGALAQIEGEVVIFDQSEARGGRISENFVSFPTPGPVAQAASTGGWLVILLADGSVHASNDPDGGWQALGDGFGAVLQTDPVVLVGESASVGLQTFDPGIGLTRLERAPFGPTVAWESAPAVYDWSTQGVWRLTDDGWARLPLWNRHGFGGTFGAMVDGVATPTVVGGDGEDLQAIWRASR